MSKKIKIKSKNVSQRIVALVGNPNSGKTTLFNELTGAKQRVSNWVGVTVEKKIGFFSFQNQFVEVVDLPGTYSLNLLAGEGAEDEIITSQFLKSGTPDFVLNVIDAVNLERNLYLTLQLLEQQLPVIIALNRIDLARKEGLQICIETLSSYLGCKVIPTVAHQRKGIDNLKEIFVTSNPENLKDFKISYPDVIEEQLQNLSQVYCELMDTPFAPRYQLLRWLEGEPVPCALPLSSLIIKMQETILAECGMDADIVIASSRWAFIERLVAAAVKKQPSMKHKIFSSAAIDEIICHRYLGLPIFLGAMYALFFFAINIGGAFQDFFELSSNALFVENLGMSLQTFNAPPWLMTLLVSGLGRGLSTILTFVPVIGAMFLALAFLEDCGYMARGAFVIDRLMRALGLPGKSFVPLIVGFGCNVPAIMGTRTLESKRDRIMAVMMSPFMSCGARLAIFTVFVAAFFPKGGQNIVFLLYLIGIFMAVLTGLLLKKTLLRGEVVPLIMEMPNYQWPYWKSIGLHTWHRLHRFVVNAGKLIIPVCMCVGLLNSINLEGKWLEKPDNTALLSVIGQAVVPVFKPLGVSEDNWPAAVGLFTGILAKEVVIGTLNALYSESQFSDQKMAHPLNLQKKLIRALQTIPTNLFDLGNAIFHPLSAKAPLVEFSGASYGEMVKRFQSPTQAFAYLLFVLLYFPCISATGAMMREVQKGWTVFSIFWTTGLAYCISVVYYQMATVMAHPLQSLGWISACFISGLMALWGIKLYSRHYLPRIVPTRIILNPL